MRVRLRLVLLCAVLPAVSVFAANAAVPVVPRPKSCVEGGRTGPLCYREIVLDSAFPEEETAAALEGLDELKSGDGTLRIRLRKQRREGYTLVRRGQRIRIRAASADMAHSALMTLVQLVRTGYDRNLRIRDWPDLPLRIFMDDVSRGEVPTVEQVKRQIRFLSELKYNAYLFYNENVTRVPSHPDYAPVEGCFTMEDLDEIGAWAQRWHVDFMGGQQSFGHMEKILALPRYRHLGLTPDMLDASSSETRAFMAEVLGDLCRHCRSDWFCLYCDETFDLERVEDREHYFADYVNYLAGVLRGHGKRAVICGDMLIRYPAIAQLLDPDIVVMTWNYDAAADFSPWIDPFKDSGREWWIAPGVHSSARMLPDMRAAEGNRRFVTEGFAAGTRGAMVCSWDETTYHPFLHLRYGIAQFAESLWDASRNAVDDGFRERYEQVYFGAPCGLTACFDGMMALADIPMYAGMNDRIFYQRFTPSPGQPLVIDTGSLRRADSLLADLSGRFDRARSELKCGEAEAEAWIYALDCYRWMTDVRLALPALLSAPDRDGALAGCDSLIAQMDDLEKRFLSIWDAENQAFSRRDGLAGFEAKKEELRAFRGHLADGSAARLSVLDRQNPYMCFWLTTLLRPGETLPAEESPAAGTPPSPGRRFSLPGREAKWTKTESLGGLEMDVNTLYGHPAPGSTLVAYARLDSAADTTVDLLLGFVGICEVWLNGEKILSDRSQSFIPDRYRLPLPLRQGQNHLYIQLAKQFPECSFSAVLEGATVTSRKHRYSL